MMIRKVIVLALLLPAIVLAQPPYQGDVVLGSTVYCPWNTFDADGAGVTRTEGTFTVYEDGDSTSDIVSAETDSKDFDGQTGAHLVAIAATSGNGFSAGHDYQVLSKGESINSATSSPWVCTFSVENRSPAVTSLNCEVNTANFAGSTTTLACILTDVDGGSVTQATGDLEGLSIEILSGADIREKRFINDTTWDAANGELQLTLSRALPSTQADGVTARIN